MIKRPRGTFCAIVLATAVAATAFTGAAFAGGGHGADSGNGKSAPSGNGNSASAGPAAQSTSADTSAPGNSGNAPGQQKKSGSADGNTQSSAPAPAATTSSPPSPGVKPGNSTGKNTDAPAASSRTKLYGNGKTAGQIAMQSGYPANGTLHGPGNSQPHKVVTCGHRHGVDVHALKSHRGSSSCGHDPGTPPPTHPSGCSTDCGTSAPPSSPPAATTPGSKSGDAGGVTTAATPGRVAALHGPSAGALGVVAAVGHGELPFTGFPLWAVVLAAVALVGAGLTIRRRAGVRA